MIEPRGSDEDTRRREFLVNVIIAGSIGLSCFLFLSASLNYIELGAKYEGIPLPFLALVVFGFIGMYLLSRNGYFRTASYLVIGAYLSGALFETIAWGPELPESTLPYTLVIIMACVLIGSRFGFILTGVIASILIVASALAENGMAHPDLSWKMEPTDVSDSIEQSAIYLIIMLVSWLSAREIARSLSRARNSEEALRRERDSLEETLAERTRELNSAQAIKIADIYRFVEFGKLASGIFHDIMSPLTSVALSIEELHGKDESAEDSPIAKAVFASRSIQSYMKALRRQISVHEKKETFSPYPIICEAILLLEYKAREDRVSIHLAESAASHAYRLHGNPLKFQQILINIISNALYACRSAEIRLSVSDSGCGMSETESQHIFEPFFTTKPESEGSGLGLSITKTIIEHDFKGTISVSTAQGKGTCFTLSIPSFSKSSESLP